MIIVAPSAVSDKSLSLGVYFVESSDTCHSVFPLLYFNTTLTSNQDRQTIVYTVDRIICYNHDYDHQRSIANEERKTKNEEENQSLISASIRLTHPQCRPLWRSQNTLRRGARHIGTELISHNVSMIGEHPP